MIRVDIIDRSPVFLIGLAQVLAADGIRVVGACTSPSDKVSWLADVALVDADALAGADGLRYLRECANFCAVVVMCPGPEPDEQRYLAAGAAKVLSKQLPGSDILRAIRGVVTSPQVPGARLPSSPGASRPDRSVWPAARVGLEAERASIADAIRMAHEYGRDADCWRLTHAMCPFYMLRSYSDDWIATHEIALAAARRSGDRLGEAVTLAELGTEGWSTARYAEATGYCERALAINREIGNLTGQAGTLRMLGSLSQRQGRYADAMRHFDESIALARQISDRRAEANALSSAAIAHYRSGRAEQAADLFREALDAYRSVEDPNGVAATLTNLGYVLVHAGRSLDARGCLEQSLALREASGDSHTGQTLTNLAIVHRGLNRPQRALEYHARALDAFRASRDRSGESEALNDFADTLVTIGPAREARRHYGEALELAVDTGNSYQQARAHEGLSRSAGDDAALLDEHRRRAVAIYAQLGTPDAARLSEEQLRR